MKFFTNFWNWKSRKNFKIKRILFKHQFFFSNLLIPCQHRIPTKLNQNVVETCEKAIKWKSLRHFNLLFLESLNKQLQKYSILDFLGPHCMLNILFGLWTHLHLHKVSWATKDVKRQFICISATHYFVTC